MPSADKQGRARNARGEPMDDFMRRTAHTGVPNSLRRMAWALDKPLQEVVDAYERAKDADAANRG